MNNPRGSILKIFISYSRKDADFAEELVSALQTCGFEPYLDKHDIAPGEPWEQRLSRLILSADTVIFVVSPDSIASERCAWEIGETERQSKRLLPVVLRGVGEAATPDRLKRLNYIFFDKAHSFGKGLASLVDALNTDVDWVREHTRLLELAARWEAAGRPADRLLREGELADAKQWLAKRPSGAQEPTPLHRAFIAEGESAENARWSQEQQQLQAMAAAQREREEALQAAEREQKAKEEAQRNRDREQKARQRVQRFALVAISALFVLSAGAGLIAIKQRDQAAGNLKFALQATDNLAVEISRELERNFEISTDDKQFLTQRLDKSLRELAQFQGGAEDFRVQHAKLLTSSALMLFDVGRFALARKYAEEANALLSSARDPGASDRAPPFVKARASLALALGQLYDMKFTDAEASLDRASEQLQVQQAAVQPLDLTLLQARVALTRAELLIGQQEHARASEIEAATRAQLKSILGSSLHGGSGSASRRSYFVDLYKSHVLRHRIASFIEPASRKQLVDEFRSDLSDGRAEFHGDADPDWELCQAFGFIFEASAHNAGERKGDAIDAISIAISKLGNVLRRDPNNLLWRYHLGTALLDRALYTELADQSAQAESDITALRRIAVSLRRDADAPYLALRLAVGADYREGQLAKRKAGGPAAFQRMIGRADVLKDRTQAARALGYYRYFGHIGAADAQLAKRDYPAALDSARAALQSADEGKLSLILRLGAYQRLLQIDPQKMPASEWDKLFQKALAEIDAQQGSSSDALLDYKAYLVSLRAGQSSNSAPIRDYNDAVAIQLEYAKRDRDDLGRLANVAYYSAYKLTRQAAAQDWAGALESSKFARASIPVGRSGTRGAAALSQGWGFFLGELHKALQTAQTAGKEAPSAIIEQLKAEVVTVEQVGKHLGQLQTTPAKPDASTANTRLDHRELDLSAVKLGTEGNILRVKEPLGWLSRPIYASVWRTLLRPELEEVALKHFNDISAADILQIRKTSLPFYDQGVLLEAEYTDRTGERRIKSVMIAGGQLYRLGGTSPPIHDANRLAPLRLTTSEEATAYLRFFTSYVTGEKGSFQLVETTEDLPWTEHAASEQKLAVAKALRPVLVWPDPENKGWWRASASIQYSDAIFHALFAIQPTGMMEMLDDEPVATDQPVDPPRFASGGRTLRTTNTIDLRIFGAGIDNDEISALSKLSREDNKLRPAHYLDLADEAAALQIATDGRHAGSLLDQAIELHFKARNFEAAYRHQENRLRLAGSAGRDTATRAIKVQLAYLALLTGNADKVPDLVSEALESNARASIELAHAHLAKGDVDAAIALYRANKDKLVGDKSWLAVAETELALISSTGRYTAETAKLREALGREKLAPVSNVLTDSPRERPPLPTSSLKEAKPQPTTSPAYMFKECGFLLGDNDSVIVVVPADLPETEIVIYVDERLLAFEAGGKIIADIAYEGGNTFERLAKLEKVGLVEYPQGRQEFPKVITKVAGVRLGRPESLL